MSKYLISILPNYIYNINKKEYYYITTHKQYLNNLLSFLFLHMNVQAKTFIDLCTVDILQNRDRFVLVYQFLSHYFHNRFFVKVNLNEISSIFSICSLYPSASWHEREAWDLFGINFVGNHDMRRILTDYGFQGFPLRKDFPLSGFVEVSYCEVLKNIKYSSVSFIQEFRLFDTKSPWEFYHK